MQKYPNQQREKKRRNAPAKCIQKLSMKVEWKRATKKTVARKTLPRHYTKRRHRRQTVVNLVAKWKLSMEKKKRKKTRKKRKANE